MASSHRSNNVYYASKNPLNIGGLREGRKQSRKAVSYVHKPSDIGSASTKYYAAAKPAQVEAQPIVVKPVVQKLVTIENKKTAKTALPAVVAAFSEGATEVIVCGSRNLVNQLRTSVELAVGRNTLTRDQADSVTFKVLADEPTKEKKAAKPVEEKTTEIVDKPSVEATPVPRSESTEPAAAGEEPVSGADIAKLFNADNYESDD